MDQHVQQRVITRGRILLLALLAAFVWLLFSIVTGGTSAVADDSVDEGGSLLGSLSASVEGVAAPIEGLAIVEEIVPVTTVTETLNELAEPLVESVAPVVERLTPVVEPLAPVVESLTPVVESLTPVIESLAPVVEALEPVLTQPLIDDTVGLLSDLVKDSPDAPTGAEFNYPLTSAEASPTATTAHEPGPAAVKVTAVTPDTRVASVPAAGSLSSPGTPSPLAPVVPTPAPAPALGQTSGAPALIASLEHAASPLTLDVASAASVYFALPSSPTFDNDTSPD